MKDRIHSKRRLRPAGVALLVSLLSSVAAFGAPPDMTAYLALWNGWTGALNVAEAELPELGMRWNLDRPEYTGAPLTPDWARVAVPEWVRPFQGKNGLPHWSASYRRPRSTCGGSVAGIDLYHANYYIVYRPETAAFIYTAYTPAEAGYVPGSLPLFEQVAARYTTPGMSGVDKLAALLKRALPAEFRHVGTAPYLSYRAAANRALLDEDLLASKGGWCNEQARILVRLCQVVGLQGRIVHLAGQAHTTAEILVDGQWVLVDVSYYAIARDAAGKLLSAAACHDLGPGQRGWAESLRRAVSRMIAMNAEQANCDPEVWEQRRENLRGRYVADEAVEALATNDKLFFSVINTPLPDGKGSVDENGDGNR